jgi:hypothetical protein
MVDRLARTKILFMRRPWPAFQVCGYTGVLLAIALVMTLVGKTGLSYWVMGVITLSSMATFLALVFATKFATGEERIIYYHHEIAAILVAGVVARLFHVPALPYLEVTILGIGVFLACGRIGCLMVGCCHGRPFAWGICYREEHAREGFAPHLVSVRLFPVQALESLWVLLVVMVGAVFVLQGRPTGSALAWYTITYGAARFCFEFARGGSDRPYTWGFSQAQWLSLWLMLALIAAEIQGLIAFTAWHAAVVACVILVGLSVTLHRKLDRAQKFELLHPHHVSEIAKALRAGRPGAKGVAVASTSRGLRISTGEILTRERAVRQYTFSRSGGGMDRETADVLARLVMQLRHTIGSSEVLAGSQGVFHLLVREEPPRELAPR